MQQEIADVTKAVEDVRKQNPMAGSWTNFVTMEFVANAQLAVGGKAAMCFLPDEAKPLAHISGAIYINMGTLKQIAAKSFPEAAKAAVELNKPWVMDPVAAGLNDTRNAIIRDLKPYKPSIIRGNASEIITLASLWELDNSSKDKLKGIVDAADTVQEAVSSALALAEHTGGTVAVTGEVDLILNNDKAYNITGGSSMLKKITGSGCSLGGVMAVFAAVTDNLTAALTGSLVYKWASATAEQNKGTATFRTSFIDNLSLINLDALTEYAKEHLQEVKIDEKPA